MRMRIALLCLFTLLLAVSCQAQQQCATVSPTSVTLPAGGGYSSDITVITTITTAQNNCGVYAPAAFGLSQFPGSCINSCNGAAATAINETQDPTTFVWTFVYQIYANPNTSCAANTMVFGDFNGQSVTATQPPGCTHLLPPTQPEPSLGPAGSSTNPQAPGGEPVSTGNGNYYYAHTDLSVFNRVPTLPLVFQRSYNSLDNMSGPLGNGWTHTYNITLGVASTGALGIRWGDGHWETFTLSGAAYISNNGGTDTLTNDQTTSTYTLTTKNGVQYFFTSTGLLSGIQDPNGRIIAISRDANNNLTSIGSGQQTFSLSYDSSNRISQIADPSGRTVSYAYDANDALISETDPAGNVTQYSYAANRQLVSITLPNSAVLLQNSYASSGRVISQINGNGLSTSFSYGTPAAGKTTITDPMGNKTVHTYDQSLRITSITDALGEVTNFTYGQTATYSYKGNPYNVFFGSAACPPECGVSGSFTVAAPLPAGVEIPVTPLSFSFTDGVATLTTTSASNPFTVVTDSSGAITGWNIYLTTPSYFIATGTNPPGCAACGVGDASGDNSVSQGAQINNAPGTWTVSYGNVENNITSVTDANGHTSNFTYDALGNVLSRTDPLGNMVLFTYNSFSEPLTITTPRGNTTNLSYDAKGNLTSVQDAEGNKTALTYDGSGNLLTLTDAKGNTTSFAYSGCSSCLGSITDALGNKTSFTYNAIGRPTAIADPNNHTSSITYDALNRVTALTDQIGNQTAFAYDPVGHLTGITDANQHKTSYGYDPVGNLILVTDAMGHDTTFTYDANNNLSTLTNGNNHITTYTYDAANRLLKTSSPKKETNTYAYDANGNVVALTDGNGKTNSYSYDANKRLTAITYSDGSTIAYTYDNDGDRLNMVDSHGTSSFSYDALNRVLSIGFPGDNNLQYGYDAVGNRTSLRYPDGTQVAYAYDPNNRLTQVTDALLRNSTYAYDPAGNLTKMLYPNGVSEQFSYDSANRLTQIVDHNAAGAFRTLSYGLDAVGNRTTASDNGVVTKYTYNPLDELKSATTAKAKTTWSYNGVGNRTTQVTPNGTTTYTYDAAEHMLTAGPSTFTYDKNGNRLSEVGPSGTTTYSYDPSNRLISVVAPNGTSSFTYDGDGNRVSQSTPAGQYSYVNDTNVTVPVVLAENGPDGPIDYNYGLGLLESSSPSFNYFYNFDALGSVTSLTDGTGALKQTYSYDAWGNSLSQTGSVGTKNKFQFTGQALDPGTGLYFMRARYYEAATGRFLNKDPFPGFAADPVTLHHYIYAGNNPVRYVDPSGKWFGGDDIGFALLGAASGLAGQATSDWLRGERSPLSAYAGQAFAGALTGWFVGNCVESIACVAIENAAGGALGSSLSKLAKGESMTPCEASRSAAASAVVGVASDIAPLNPVTALLSGVLGSALDEGSGAAGVCNGNQPSSEGAVPTK